MHPQSYSWDTKVELLAAILHTLQGANWQRSGGKGAKPKPIKRPTDTPVRRDKEPLTAAALQKKKKAFNDELAKRRAAKQEERRLIKEERQRRREGMVNGSRS